MLEMRAAGSKLIGKCAERSHLLTRELQSNANTVTETYNTGPQTSIITHFLHLLITCVCQPFSDNERKVFHLQVLCWLARLTSGKI